jgi:hypothetical protein
MPRETRDGSLHPERVPSSKWTALLRCALLSTIFRCVALRRDQYKPMYSRHTSTRGGRPAESRADGYRDIAIRKMTNRGQALRHATAFRERYSIWQ